MTVDQPTANPTNKLTAATLANALVALAFAIVSKFWPEFADPTIWAAVFPIAGFVAGWIVRDRPNVEIPGA